MSEPTASYSSDFRSCCCTF